MRTSDCLQVSLKYGKSSVCSEGLLLPRVELFQVTKHKGRQQYFEREMSSFRWWDTRFLCRSSKGRKPPQGQTTERSFCLSNLPQLHWLLLRMSLVFGFIILPPWRLVSPLPAEDDSRPLKSFERWFGLTNVLESHRPGWHTWSWHINYGGLAKL